MKERRLSVNGKCPGCKREVKMGIDIEPLELAPDLRGEMKPASSIYEYKITSEDMKRYLIRKARKYAPDVKLELIPRYCEKKRRRPNDPHRSYASLRIALSDHVVEKKEDLGWYGKIGESSSNVQIIENVTKKFIQRFQYHRQDIELWMKNYKSLEELEEALGMTEAYINDLKTYSTPHRILDINKESWIIFAGAPENVIKDMFIDPSTEQVAGKIQIKDVYPISEEVVEWTVHLYPSETQAKDNPHVRQILMGNQKFKN